MRYRALFEQAADAIVVFDPKTLVILDFNDEACRRLGYTRAEFAKLNISDFEVIESVAEVKRHSQSVTMSGVEIFETQHRTKTGTVLDIEIRAKTIRIGDRMLIQGIWRDITARKQAEASQRKTATELERRVMERTAEVQLANQALLREMTQRRELERQILEISEREQRRIGHDLHDGVGQHLTAVKFLSSSLTKRLARQKVSGALSAARISRELEKVLEEMHGIARGLHPIRPDGESLMAALHELAISVRKLFRISCQLECPRPVVIHDYHVATHLYRIVQEAVSNAASHAKPRNIRIKLHQDNRGIHLRVTDDGRGLPPPTKRKTGLGLGIMKYRASMIGATFDIGRSREGGTQMTCTWKPPAGDEKGTTHAR